MSRLFIKSPVDLALGRMNRTTHNMILGGPKSHLSSSSCREHVPNESLTSTTMNSSPSCPIDLNQELLASAIMMAKKLDGNPLMSRDFNGGKIKPPLDKINKNKDFIVDDIVDKENNASPEQLTHVANVMTNLLPKFITTPHPFDMYKRDMVFINRIRSTRTQGIGQYAVQLALTKMYFNLNYTSTRVELLNLVTQPEESCIKIRWRFVSKPGILRFMLFFYKFHSSETWIDGISTMYVNKEGKIYCHVCDNIDVEQDKIKTVIKNPLVNRGLNV